ncbi:nucleoside-diphosphate kinase [Nanobdella aerobiophila]|uniref:nucleoside-diphosphate kinase n=1 Tax=Nanobdella aerobiophila TaxID=2586965 RepID=A0A915WSV6_9ARCH|nr:nucleoside-diphosphate kinase [Nanobdella aerobiophila]BBL45597.1 nucleoside-diphosphate kinase [Nanobdella aerobiophila]
MENKMSGKDLVQKTLVLIKPDSVKRGLIGEIISRFEKVGLKIVALKMVKLDKKTAEEFYYSDENWLATVGSKTLTRYREMGLDPKKEFNTDDPKEIGKIIRQWLIDFITSAPIVAIVLEGVNSIEEVRKLVGSTEPLKAPPGTIRGDYAHMSIAYANWNKIVLRNVVHASENEKDAMREIFVIFKLEEIYNYTRNIEEVIY